MTNTNSNWRLAKLGTIAKAEIALLDVSIHQGWIIDTATDHLKEVYRQYCAQTGNEYIEIDIEKIIAAAYAEKREGKEPTAQSAAKRAGIVLPIRKS